MMKALTDLLASALTTERTKLTSQDPHGSTETFADTMDGLLASTRGGANPLAAVSAKMAPDLSGASVSSAPETATQSLPMHAGHTFSNQMSESPETSEQVISASQPQLMDELTMDITKPGHEALKSTSEVASTSSDVTLTSVAVQEVGLEGVANKVFHATMTEVAGNVAQTQIVGGSPGDGASPLLQSTIEGADELVSANVDLPVTLAQTQSLETNARQQMPVDALAGAQTVTTRQTDGLPLLATPLTDDAHSADFTLTMVETGRKLAAHSPTTSAKAMPVTGTANATGVTPDAMPETAMARTSAAASDWLGLTDRQQFSDMIDTSSHRDAKTEAHVDRAAGITITTSALKADLTSGSQRVMDLGTRISTVEPQQFGNEMATHVRVLKSQSGGEVKLNLHPAELGRMSISVSTDGNDTRVAFVVETPQARQAVEAALPRLRDMLDSAGLSLSDSDVSEEREHQTEWGDESSGRSRRGASSTDNDDLSGSTTISLAVDPDRLIDTYI